MIGHVPGASRWPISKVSLTLFLLVSLLSIAHADPVPDELIGAWGNSPAQCRSFNRKVDGVKHISRREYSWCSGTGCGAKIIDVSPSLDGFTMTLQGRGAAFQKQFIRIQPGVFEADGEAFVKCTEADAIAGIGRALNSGEEKIDGPSVAFSAYYALAVPKYCAGLTADSSKVGLIASAGIVKYLKVLRRFRVEGASEESLAANFRQDGEAAARMDAEDIADFCTHVMKVFGSDGSLLPGLLSDGSKPL
jgi:hypothetical protein